MRTKPDLLVFTDLDGTLIDHETYQWEAAKPALAALRSIGAGVVLASSKTAQEIASLRTELALTDWPAIVENGAGRLEPRAEPRHQDSRYHALRAILDELPADMRQLFTGFGDWTASEVAQDTGLSREQARLAKQRAFSEPGIWRGSDADLIRFQQQLRERGVTTREGGRYLTLSFGGNKSDQITEIIAQVQPRHTVALGDAPNDVEMLSATDYGIIIHNPHRKPLPILANETTGRIHRTQEAGPLGWNAAILDLLKKLDLGQG